MKKIMIGTFVAAGAALMAAGAYAGEGKGGGHWDRMDTNGDGEISADEMSERNASFLENADADGNGSVSRNEMKTFHEARKAERRAKMNPDKNGDGNVDRNEFVAAAQSRFDRMDKDGNGVLSEDEQRRRRGHHRRGDRNHGGDKG